MRLVFFVAATVAAVLALTLCHGQLQPRQSLRRTCVVFSGGGMRSAFLTSQAMQVLSKRRDLNIVGFSGLSGGSWGLARHLLNMDIPSKAPIGFKTSTSDMNTFVTGLNKFTAGKDFHDLVLRPGQKFKIALGAAFKSNMVHGPMARTKKIQLVNFCFVEVTRRRRILNCPWAGKSWRNLDALDHKMGIKANSLLNVLSRSGAAAEFVPWTAINSLSKILTVEKDTCKPNGLPDSRHITGFADAGAYHNTPFWVWSKSECDQIIAFDFSASLHLTTRFRTWFRMSKPHCGKSEWESFQKWCSANSKCCTSSNTKITKTRSGEYKFITTKYNGIPLILLPFRKFGCSKNCCNFVDHWPSAITLQTDNSVLKEFAKSIRSFAKGVTANVNA